MRTYLTMKKSHDSELPEQFRDDDVRYTRELVRHFLDVYTKPGDVVLDPFAGFGTTLLVAEAMRRIPYGIEYDQQRAAFIRTVLQKYSEHLICGDARRLASYELPLIDFSMTSPPYMTSQSRHNPLTAYQTLDGNYRQYLQEIRDVYQQLTGKLKPGAHVVLEVANLKHEQGTTPLAWHIAEQVSGVLRFEGEIVVCWDEYGYGYDHSYCLIFAN